VESSGEIRGDVMASQINRERGGRILGEQRQMPMPGAGGVTMPRITPTFPDMSGIFLIILQVFVVVIVLALGSGPVGRIIDTIEHGVVKSFFWGLLVWFAVLPIFVLLIITIVGIPIALLIYPFALLLALILAFVSSAAYIGRQLSPLLGWEDRSSYLKAILGVVAVGAILILSNLAGAVGIEALRGLLAAIFVIIVFVALTVGLGGAVAAKFGMRPKPAHPGPQYPQAPTVSPPPPPRMDTRSQPPSPPAPPPPTPPSPPSRGGSSDATYRDDYPPNNQ
jgi:MFS family permease